MTEKNQATKSNEVKQEIGLKCAEEPLSLGAQIAVLALSICGLCGGWLVLLGNGFHTQIKKHSSETTFVAGGPALLISMICFMWAGVGIFSLLVEKKKPKWMKIASIPLVFVPPVIYLVLKSSAN